jgi:hypothetical protein
VSSIQGSVDLIASLDVELKTFATGRDFAVAVFNAGKERHMCGTMHDWTRRLVAQLGKDALGELESFGDDCFYVQIHKKFNRKKLIPVITRALDPVHAE